MTGFWAALLGGKLLKPATVSEMFGTLYPMFDAGQYYGLGVMAIDVPSYACPDLGRAFWRRARRERGCGLCDRATRLCGSGAHWRWISGRGGEWVASCTG